MKNDFAHKKRCNDIAPQRDLQVTLHIHKSVHTTMILSVFQSLLIMKTNFVINHQVVINVYHQMHYFTPLIHPRIIKRIKFSPI